MKNRWLLTLYGLCIIVISVCVNGVKDKNDSEQLKILEESIQKGIIQCYALEGYYPPNITYIEENYGMVINHEIYEVYYEIFASNIMPIVKVVYKTWGE